MVVCALAALIGFTECIPIVDIFLNKRRILYTISGTNFYKINGTFVY